MSDTLWIVTGASRGFGRAVATAVAHDAASSSNNDAKNGSLRLVLIARSEQNLFDTKKNIILSKNDLNNDNSIEISCHVMDLSNLETLEEELQNVLTTYLGPDKIQQYSHVYLINNAGTIGFVGPIVHTPFSLQNFRSNFDLNITSSFWITLQFTKLLLDYYNKYTTTTTTSATAPAAATIVQVSSLGAVANFPSMGMYCAGKSARDRYHSILALETKDTNIKVLNYAPGPLETDMVTEIRNAPELDASLQPAFAKQQLNPLDSATVLINLLQSNTFTSGDHVDYYDIQTNQTENFDR